MPAPPMPSARPRRVSLYGELATERAVELTGPDRAPVVLSGEWAGVTAIVAGEPLEIVTDPDRLQETLDRETPLLDGDAGVCVGGGWLGMIGYEAAARLADPDASFPPATERLPAALLAYYDHVLVRDEQGRWWLEMLWTQGRDSELQRRAGLLRERLAAVAARDRPVVPAGGPWSGEPTPAGHALAVEACRDRIGAGDLYQANLAMRLRADSPPPAAAAFAAGIAGLSPQRAAYMSGDWGSVASLSPELLIERRGRSIRSEPIKGTRPKPADPTAAAALRDELAGSEKDRAENVMIVDLMRNDLGRVCDPGSIVADGVCEVRELAGVWHLSSTVTGTLTGEVTDGALAAAVLPAGSVTGAPKIAALRAIAELESSARQAFCGSFALASPVSGLELSVAIRTLEFAGGEAWLDVGGGITGASDPETETAECLAKAAPLLGAIGGWVATPTSSGVAPELLRLGAVPLPRPDERAGVFTTLRSDDGRAEHVAEHLARLEASTRALYGRRLPVRLARQVRDTAAATRDAQRIRVTARPNGETTVEAFSIAAPDDPVVLAPVCLPGGLGCHKWADRRLAVAFEQHCAPAEPLFCGLDGEVYEASRWALVADIGGELVTPPAGGRILPSIGIAVLHEALRPVPRPLRLDDLAGARALYVINAVRGMVPVRELRGVWESPD